MQLSSLFHPRRLLWLGLIAVAGLSVGALAADRAAEPAAAPAAAPAADAPAGSVRPNDERLRGLTRPSKTVQLNAPLDGRLALVNVHEGEHVKAGQLLAKMDDSIEQVNLAGAKLRAADDSEIRKQQMLLGENQIQYDRMVELAKSGSAQDWEVRRAKLQRDGTQAALDAAINADKLEKQNVHLEEVKLDHYNIRAPFDGVVTRIDTQAGSSLTTNRDSIMTVVQLDPLEAQIFLPVELFGQLHVGTTYRLHAESPVNADLSGKLKTIEPLIDAASGTFRCVFDIDNPDLKLPAGFTVRLIWPQP